MENIAELINKFCECAIKQHKFTLEGNYKKNNAEVEKINTICQAIKKLQKMEELLKLIYSDNPIIASEAATSCLRYNPDKCLAVFNKLAKENIPFISMGAEYAIQNWKNGEWYID
jgi:hypothetical protein